MSLDDSRMCKLYNEYKICNMQREDPARWAGFKSMFIDWKLPPLILDWLADVLPPSIEKLHAFGKGEW